eukprot:jgi/Chrzof1/6072/Cz17g07200.t1
MCWHCHLLNAKLQTYGANRNDCSVQDANIPHPAFSRRHPLLSINTAPQVMAGQQPRLLLLLLALFAVSASAVKAAVCSLMLQGFDDGRQGVQHASMSCAGNLEPISVGVNRQYLDTSKGNFTGVRVVAGPPCNLQQWRNRANCLLYLCGQFSITFDSPVITGVSLCHAANTSRDTTNILCLEQQAKVTINKGRLHHNCAGSLLLADDSSSVSISHSSITHNHGHQGLTAAGTSTLTIRATNISHNTADTEGGAVQVMDDARLVVTDGSILSHNRATSGAGLHAMDRSQLFVDRGSIVANNNATAGNGGGACLSNSAKLVVAGSSTFAFNTAVGGGAVYVASNARLTITGASSFNSNTAGGGGGGAVNVHDNGEVSIEEGSSIVNNTSTGFFGGGAVLHNAAMLTLTGGSKFVNNTSHQYSGGGLCALDSARVTITNGSSFQGNAATGYAGGGVAAMDGSSVTVTNGSTIVSNTAADSVGGGIYVTSTAKLTIAGSSMFANNSANGGAGVYVESNGTFVCDGNSTFTGNAATTYGGALAAYNNATLELTSCELGGNSAKTGGGVYIGPTVAFSSDALLRAIRVKPNTAETNANIAAVPTRMQLIGSSHVDNFVSRYPRDKGLLPVAIMVSTAGGLGYEGMLLHAIENGSELLGGNIRTNKSGIAKFTDLKLRKPQGQYTVTFTAWDEYGDATLAPITLNVTVRSCLPGEIVFAGDTCEPCAAGTYSFDPTAVMCETCPLNAQCPGRTSIMPQEGYWHSTADSAQVHRCPNSDACKGNRNRTEMLKMDQQCSPEYVGNLCGSCKPNHGMTRPFTCQPCLSNQSALLALHVLAALLLLGLVAWTSHSTLVDNMRNESGARTNVSDVLKVLVVYMQYMVVVAAVHMDWPASLLYPFRALTWIWSASSSQTVSFDCMLAREGPTPLAVNRVLLYLLMPVGMFVVLAVFQGAVAALMRIRRRTSLRSHGHASISSRLGVSAMVTTFFFYPSLVRTVLGMFSCMSIDQPFGTLEGQTGAAVGTYWVYDLNQLCWEGYHRVWGLPVGVVGTAVLCVGVPAVMGVTLWWNRSQLEQQAFRVHFGFLYHIYRPACYLWEVVVTVQTAVLMAVTVFGAPLGPYYQTLLLNASLGCMLVLTLYIDPLKSRGLRHLQLASLTALFITSYASLSFLPAATGQFTNNKYKEAMGAVVLLLNVAFLGYAVYSVLFTVPWQRLRQLSDEMLTRVGLQSFSSGLPQSNRATHGNAGPGRHHKLQEAEAGNNLNYSARQRLESSYAAKHLASEDRQKDQQEKPGHSSKDDVNMPVWLM